MKYCRLSRRNEGSALLLVLLIVMLLSMLGLALTFTTEIEMQLGAAEQIVVKTVYGAEAGLHIATSGILTTQEWTGKEFAVIESQFEGHSLGTRVATTRTHAVGSPQSAPMTMANLGESVYHSYSTVVQGTAERVGWPNENKILGDADWITPIDNDDAVVQSRRSVAVRYLLSPLPTPASPSQPYNAEKAVMF